MAKLSLVMLGFAQPLFLLGLLSLPVALLLHYLRRARQERQAVALWLWPRADTPLDRRRFRLTPLLLCQLLALAALSVGAAGPRVVEPGRDLAIIVEAGGGMTATDLKPTRLAAALVDAASLLRYARRVVIVRAGLVASVAQAPDQPVSAAGAALKSIAAGDSSVDLAAAVALARQQLPGAEMHLFSSLPAPPSFRGVWHSLRGSGRNVGIVAFGLRGSQVFAALASNQPGPVNAAIVLTRDGRPLASATVRVPAGGRGVWTANLPDPSGEYRLMLAGPQDVLALDDLAVASRSSGEVLVTPAQPDVLRAAASVPGARVNTTERLPGNADGFAVVILAGPVPKSLPPGRYIIFAPPAAAGKLPPLETLSAWDATSDLLRFVNLMGVKVRISPVPAPALANGSWSTIARASDTPFISVGEAPGVRAIYVASHPLDSAFAASPAFPVFMFNALSGLLAAQPVPLGSRLPAGAVKLDGQEAPGLRAALTPGVYDTAFGPWAVSAASVQVTALPTGAPAVQRMSGDVALAPRGAALRGETGARSTLALLAAAALLLEYFLRTRRSRRVVRALP